MRESEDAERLLAEALRAQAARAPQPPPRSFPAPWPTEPTGSTESTGSTAASGTADPTTPPTAATSGAGAATSGTADPSDDSGPSDRSGPHHTSTARPSAHYGTSAPTGPSSSTGPSGNPGSSPPGLAADPGPVPGSTSGPSAARLAADAGAASGPSATGLTTEPRPSTPGLAADPGPMPWLTDAGPMPGASEQTATFPPVRPEATDPIAGHAAIPQRYGLLSGTGADSLARERAALESATDPTRASTPTPDSATLTDDAPTGRIPAAATGYRPPAPVPLSAGWVLLLAVLLGLAAGSLIGLITVL